MKLWDNAEIKIYLRLLAVSIVLITADLMVSEGFDAMESVGYAVFQVISVSSTTAFVTSDFGQWPEFSHRVRVRIMGVCISTYPSLR